MHIYASGGKTARVDVRIFAFLLFAPFLPASMCLRVIFSMFASLGFWVGGGGGVITSFKLETCLRRWS